MERKKLIYKIGAQTTITCNAMHERKKEWMRGWRGSGYMKHKKDDRLKENWVIYPINSYNFTKIRRWSSDDAWEKETKRETSREIKLATQNNTIVHVTKFFTWIPLNMQFFPSPLYIFYNWRSEFDTIICIYSISMKMRVWNEKMVSLSLAFSRWCTRTQFSSYTE